MIIDAKVYDLSRFAAMHPGGSSVLFADAVGACVLLILLNIKLT